MAIWNVFDWENRVHTHFGRIENHHLEKYTYLKSGGAVECHVALPCELATFEEQEETVDSAQCGESRLSDEHAKK